MASDHILVVKQAGSYSFSVDEEGVTSIHLQIMGLNGRMIFDSGWVVGMKTTWPLVTNKGHVPTNGIYVYAISVRRADGQEERKLGKLAVMRGRGPMLSLPQVSEIAETQPTALPGGVKWQERLAKDNQDNFRIQRRPGNGQPFQNLLTLDNAGRLTIPQLCLSGDCRNVWPGLATAGGWTDEGAVVHLSNAADRVGLGTATPNEQLEITGNFRLPPAAVTSGTPTAGVIFSGSDRFIHNFGAANFFAGVKAGNFAMSGIGNTGVGASALHINTTGSVNTAVGRDALWANTTGNFNTAVGGEALAFNSAGSSNTAVGSSALFNTTGNDNTAVGRNALSANNSGDSNTAMGRDALDENTTGDSNTAMGKNALASNTAGDFNTAVGSAALSANTIGFNNTALGFAADVSTNGLSNATAIGANAIVNASNKVRIGDTAVTVIEGQVDWTFTSDRNRKEHFLSLDGLAVLEKLQRISVTSWNYIGDDPQRRHYGPMAQDFFAAFGHDGVGTIGTDKTLTGSDVDGILMISVQALYALSLEKDKEITELQERLEQLERLVAQLMKK
jgi:hypothetical protein